MKKSKGNPKPFGANKEKKGINFALFSKHATKITLVLEVNKETIYFHLDPKENRTGDIWHILLSDLPPLFVYYYFIDGPHKSPHYYHPHQPLCDPYAKCLNTTSVWEDRNQAYHPKGYYFEADPFDWENISSPRLQMDELIIYEMHVRGFTQHSSSEVQHPGTFLGLIEKIPYLKSLGINAVELMPIQEFHECGYSRLSSKNKVLCNYWGYSTVNYFAPMNRYATSYKTAIQEFKTLVRELHRNQIEVILDIVFNHTAEKGKQEGLFSFMGIDHSIYYMLHNGYHTNFSGCGHTTNVNHPVFKQLIKEVLHYWVSEMHVDGFRFDLASILNRDTKGKLLQPSTLIEDLSQDPLLSTTKLIAEPWDLGGYQLGGFFPHETRWSEWNDKYRDAIRKFIKGDPHSKNDFATRITGSQDIFPARRPSASINFITAHDGFTLHDLVSYNQKHNKDNGEHNKDGKSQTFSWNMGQEGKTDNPDIINLRNRQMKNFMVALLISRGTPMIYMGDEYGHTKKGNNNTWCQDNELNWFLWDQVSPFTDFVKNMIQFRKNHPIFDKDIFYKNEIIWHGLNIEDPNWEDQTSVLACTIIRPDKRHLYIAFNATTSKKSFQLPLQPSSKKWMQVVNTALAPLDDFLPKGKEIPITNTHYELEPFSSLILECT